MSFVLDVPPEQHPNGKLKHLYFIIELNRLFSVCPCTVNPALSGHSKIDKTKILKTHRSLMKVESISECLGAFCNTFDLH